MRFARPKFVSGRGLNTQPLITYTACNLRKQTKNLSGSDTPTIERYCHNPLKTYVSFNRRSAMFPFALSTGNLPTVSDFDTIVFAGRQFRVPKKCNTREERVLENAGRLTFLSITFTAVSMKQNKKLNVYREAIYY